MSFTDIVFVTLFLPVSLCLLLLLRKHISKQNLFILLVNFVFVIFSGIGGFCILFLICIIDYAFVRLLQKELTEKAAALLFVTALIINLTPLLLFKYTRFVISSVNSALSLGIAIPGWAAPLGISFFTFQSISLLADVKTRKIKYKPKFFDICFYLSFFPNITSGPIMRFDDIHSQLEERAVTAENISAGTTRFVIGLSKKVLIANILSIYVNDIFSRSSVPGAFSVLTYWMGSIAFTLQLYLDFSGYTDMAIGISNILGFRLKENFDHPYTARTIGEFWRKWHITLSQWFRDYVYIPLGGNRVSKPRHIYNLFIVWLLTGIWHGANWTFIVWGLLYFVLLVFEKYCKKASAYLHNHFIGHIYTLFFVNLLWVFFRADSLYDAGQFILRMFGIGSIGIPVEQTTLHIIPFLVFSFVCCLPVSKSLSRFEGKRFFKVVKSICVCILIVLSVFVISNSAATPFIYGKF